MLKWYLLLIAEFVIISKGEKKLTFSISAFQEDYAQLEHPYEIKKLL